MTTIDRIQMFLMEYLKIDMCFCVDIKKGAIILSLIELSVMIMALGLSSGSPFFFISLLGSVPVVNLLYGIYRKKPLYLLPNLLKWMTIHAAIILPFIVLTSFRLFGILSFVEQSRYMPYPEEKGLAFIWVFITQMPSGNFWLIWISCVFLYLCTWFIASVIFSLFVAMEKEQKENAAKLPTATAPRFSDMDTIELNRV